MLESIIRKSIVNHTMRNQFLNVAQHGFVPCRNGMAQLLLCIQEWTAMSGNGLAFDTVYTEDF